MKINHNQITIIHILRMGSKMKQLMMMSILIMSLTGCVPKMHTVSPQIEGKVVDAKTGKPLSGAQVALKHTNLNGRFVIEGKRELGIGTPMGGVWRLPTIMVPVWKKGYKGIYCQCSGLSNNIYGCTNVTIALMPLDKNVTNDMIKSTQNDNFSCRTVERAK